MMLVWVWLSLVGLLAGEVGAARRHRTGVEPWWAWPASMAGCLALCAHMLLAMASRHQWSHQAALLDTARQTAEVYGVAWGGGLWVNYAFAGLWMAWLTAWKASPARFWNQPRWQLWGARAFVFVIVLNAAVVFAAPQRRLAGAALTLALPAAWWFGSISKAPRRDRPGDLAPPARQPRGTSSSATSDLRSRT